MAAPMLLKITLYINYLSDFDDVLVDCINILYLLSRDRHFSLGAPIQQFSVLFEKADNVMEINIVAGEMG